MTKHLAGLVGVLAASIWLAPAGAAGLAPTSPSPAQAPQGPGRTADLELLEEFDRDIARRHALHEANARPGQSNEPGENH
jgi:hypothetical protein